MRGSRRPASSFARSTHRHHLHRHLRLRCHRRRHRPWLQRARTARRGRAVRSCCPAAALAPSCLARGAGACRPHAARAPARDRPARCRRRQRHSVRGCRRSRSRRSSARRGHHQVLAQRRRLLMPCSRVAAAAGAAAAAPATRANQMVTSAKTAAGAAAAAAVAVALSVAAGGVAATRRPPLRLREWWARWARRGDLRRCRAVGAPTRPRCHAAPRDGERSDSRVCRAASLWHSGREAAGCEASPGQASVRLQRRVGRTHRLLRACGNFCPRCGATEPSTSPSGRPAMPEPLAMAASTRRSEEEEEGAVEAGAEDVRGGRWDEGKARGVTGVGRR